ncbi:allophanate hydrolase [Cellulosimicrobium protaetiae]|uniref:Allophanate hydrolase n=1 Tax=Cellulosimicrobium protaetiae TaxID=2587808 RepID=A0A6M5UFE7_9MICO|nr:allophanate hydrolase [Cellulosimicrobium protaetiae]QJW35848.1 allophanate hydrolase [Cellulosimicrobium protaetiae]
MTTTLGPTSTRAAAAPATDPTTAARYRVRRAFARIAEVDRPEVWITLRAEEDVLADLVDVHRRADAGQRLPLAGVLVAVKDNIDVAGLPTTAAAPSFASTPDVSAPCVQRLVDAGAVVLGKTNLDQFATGLVGVRSPYGAVRHATLPDRVSGGSSSGSAVAVALDVVDLALGTDTAGSGRVPAALHGLVGIKTTVGLVPTDGVVPACRSFDVVTTFSRDVALGRLATSVMTRPGSPAARSAPADARLGLRWRPVVAVPVAANLEALDPAWREAFATVPDRLAALGAEVVERDVAPLLDAARLLYDGALVAERYAAVGAAVDAGGPDLDPTVAAIIGAGRDVPAHRYVTDRAGLDRTRTVLRDLLDGVDLLVTPTTTEHPTIAAVQADPVAINARMGTFTNFVNLLDLAAVALPAGVEAAGTPLGVTVLARAFEDDLALDLAARWLGEPTGAGEVPLVSTAATALLAVFGAHLRGQPLHHELEALGARFLHPVRTSARYRLVALGTTPPKPGLVRVGTEGGASIAGELYEISVGGLGAFLRDLPAPMTLGAVTLDDGSSVVGFGCTHEAVAGARDVTAAGSWPAYLAERSGAGTTGGASTP